MPLCSYSQASFLFSQNVRILDAAKKAGIPAGVPIGGPDAKQRMVDAGSQLVVVGDDSVFIQSSADRALKEFQEFIEKRKLT